MAIFTENGNKSDGPVLLLAHGAGAPADSPFMNELAVCLDQNGVTTVRFEFPYMQKRRADGKKRPPDRQPALLQSFEQMVDHLSAGSLAQRPLFIGGKSMGGRMASLLGAEPALTGRFQGVVCFGYPFHPPGKPERWRTGHFGELWCPLLVVQGTRDPFGKREEVSASVPSNPLVDISWLDGGDHDFRPLARQVESHSQMLQRAAQSASAFMHGNSRG
ncbi:MAG: alpha/beta family hydrolase [Marinobacter sp.]|uniref:alpha/beta family hydrolase n=1 Tax=Marinobacter sp. TaxID=50741 RepID=UPI003C68C55F